MGLAGALLIVLGAALCLPPYCSAAPAKLAGAECEAALTADVRSTLSRPNRDWQTKSWRKGCKVDAADLQACISACQNGCCPGSGKKKCSGSAEDPSWCCQWNTCSGGNCCAQSQHVCRGACNARFYGLRPAGDCTDVDWGHSGHSAVRSDGTSAQCDYYKGGGSCALFGLPHCAKTCHLCCSGDECGAGDMQQAAGPAPNSTNTSVVELTVTQRAVVGVTIASATLAVGSGVVAFASSAGAAGAAGVSGATAGAAAGGGGAGGGLGGGLGGGVAAAPGLQALAALGVASTLQHASVLGRFQAVPADVRAVASSFDFANFFFPPPFALSVGGGGGGASPQSSSSSSRRRSRSRSRRDRRLALPATPNASATTDGDSEDVARVLLGAYDDAVDFFVGNIFWVSVILAAELVAIGLLELPFWSAGGNNRYHRRLRAARDLARDLFVTTLCLCFQGMLLSSAVLISESFRHGSVCSSGAANATIGGAGEGIFACSGSGQSLLVLAWVVTGLVLLVYPSFLFYYLARYIRPLRLELYDASASAKGYLGRRSAAQLKATGGSTACEDDVTFLQRQYANLRPSHGGERGAQKQLGGISSSSGSSSSSSSSSSSDADGNGGNKGTRGAAPPPVSPSLHRRKKAVRKDLRRCRDVGFHVGATAFRATGRSIVYLKHAEPAMGHVHIVDGLANTGNAVHWRQRLRIWCLAARLRHRCCTRLCGGKRPPQVSRGHWARPQSRRTLIMASLYIQYDASRWYWAMHLPVATFIRAVLAAVGGFSSVTLDAQDNTAAPAAEWALPALLVVEVLLLAGFVLDDPFRMRDEMWLFYTCQACAIAAVSMALSAAAAAGGGTPASPLNRTSGSSPEAPATAGGSTQTLSLVILILYNVALVARMALLLRRWRVTRSMKVSLDAEARMRERRSLGLRDSVSREGSFDDMWKQANDERLKAARLLGMDLGDDTSFMEMRGRRSDGIRAEDPNTNKGPPNEGGAAQLVVQGERRQTEHDFSSIQEARDWATSKLSRGPQGGASETPEAATTGLELHIMPAKIRGQRDTEL